jgi:hypothetical protein
MVVNGDEKMKCHNCEKELPEKDYRGKYTTIVECDCGAINYTGKEED